jgi:shikimate dehydrogenase
MKLKTIAAVLGSPVTQSLSPAIHNAAFEQMSKPWRYVAIDVDAEYFAEEVFASRDAGMLGLSITMPHKDAAYSLVQHRDEIAQRSGSVNTIVFDDSGTLRGANTDGDGCCDALVRGGATIEGSRAVVLGAGGTARAVVAALGLRGAADISIVNRTQSRASEASECADVARVGSESDIADATLLVNTTSVGMGTFESPVSASFLHSSLTVLDAVYHPLETAFIAQAREAGARTVDGLWMLICQAVRQEELWCGMTPDPQVMRSAALRELALRAA